jgi:hypothetical protein
MGSDQAQAMHSQEECRLVATVLFECRGSPTVLPIRSFRAKVLSQGIGEEDKKRRSVSSGHACFEAAFAVRQVEIGLAALFNVPFGFTTAALGIGIVSSSRYPPWLGAGDLVVALAGTSETGEASH